MRSLSNFTDPNGRIELPGDFDREMENAERRIDFEIEIRRERIADFCITAKDMGQNGIIPAASGLMGAIEQIRDLFISCIALAGGGKNDIFPVGIAAYDAGYPQEHTCIGNGAAAEFTYSYGHDMPSNLI